MNRTAEKFEQVMELVHRHRGLILPIVAAGLIFAILVPLPTMLMDILLAGNIALAALILLTTIYVSNPLEFSVFPSLLLGATLFRLVLNIATTRLILTAGENGADPQTAQFAAGHVIWAFSQFVAIGSLEVGVILFTIIAVIQFVVITRGASRISEVAARFVLDAMPSKQMAVDADLNAGLIDESQAHTRRHEIAREADFYGAMDGASKFIRGDAAAGVLITLVNILGGLYMGMVRYDWSFSETIQLFTRLTIGDGLVAQIPSLIISVAAALLVTRSRTRTNLGEEMVGQLTSRPIVLGITAVFLGLLAFTSLPKVPLILVGIGLGGLAYLLSRNEDEVEEFSEKTPSTLPAARNSDPAKIVKPTVIEPLRIELGYALVCLVDETEGGDLLDRISALRKQLGDQLGLLVPPVKITDNMSLECRTYQINIRGSRVAVGQLQPRRMMALSGEETLGEIHGIVTTEPTFGTPAIWIARSQRDEAEMLGYTVVEPSAVLTTHLEEVIRVHAAELLSRQQITQLLDTLAEAAPVLVKEARERFRIGQIQKVLQNLLGEGVPIRDMETILESLCDSPESIHDPDALTERVRWALRRLLTQQFCESDGRLWCVSLTDSLENEIGETIGAYESEVAPGNGSPRTKQISKMLAEGLTRLTHQGRKPIVLCSAQVRLPLKKMLSTAMPEVAVLGYNEVDSAEVQSVGRIGIE